MSETTTIDVTNQAPSGRVVGQMPECPNWCTSHDYGGQTEDRQFAVIHTGSTNAPDAEVTVDITIMDTVRHDKSIVRGYFLKVFVGDADELSAGAAQVLSESLAEAARIGSALIDEHLLAAKLIRAGDVRGTGS